MAYVKLYERINWENYPSIASPINEINLNKIDYAVNELDNRVVTLSTVKADLSELSSLFSGIEYNESTGVITFTRYNGTTFVLNTKLEKLAINFSYDTENEQLVITLDDGTKQYVDMSALITQYEFLDSDTIGFTLSDGKVTADVIDGSITDKKLQPNYLADITVQAQTATAKATAAATSATEAEASAVRAEIAADNAEATLKNTFAKDDVIPISNGGTGGTTAKEAQYNLLSIMVDESSKDVTDDALFVGTYITSNDNGVIYKRTALKLWNYINAKAESVFATKNEVAPVNNLLATVAGKPLDAVQGAVLNENITSKVKGVTDYFAGYSHVPVIMAFYSSDTIPAHGSVTTIQTVEYKSQKYYLSLFGLSAGNSNIYRPSNSGQYYTVISEMYTKIVSMCDVDLSGIRLVSFSFPDSSKNSLMQMTFINETNEDITLPPYVGYHQYYVIVYIPSNGITLVE